MLKLLLCSALMAPVFVLAFTSTSGASLLKSDGIIADPTFVDSQLTNLQNCQPATLDVFFHEGYVTLHSAELIAEGVHATKFCTGAKYVITPIATRNETDTEIIAQTTELSLMLEAHGVKATTSSPVTSTQFDTLISHGQAAALTVNFDVGGDNT